jgi:hypothetical protein
LTVADPTGELIVNFDEVSEVGHTHDAATSGAAGFMSAADKIRFDALLTQTQQDARYITKVGSATVVQTVTTELVADGGDGSAPGLTVTRDIWGKTKVYVGATADTWLYRDSAAVMRIDGDFISYTSPSAGSGSPEGVVTKSPGAPYWDYTNKRSWVKQSGSATNTGWEQVTG